MRYTHLTAALVALVVAATGYGLHLGSGSQRHQPPSSLSQSAQRREAPRPQPKESAPRQAVPQPHDQKDGRTKPPDATVAGPAVPRPPAVPHPGHPVHPLPYPGPWYGWYGYPWYPYPYAYPWGYPLPPATIAADWATSNVRLDVTPKDASVYVDRYFAGTVNDFSGTFHHLTLSVGPHLIEIRKEHYRSLVLEVNLQPAQTITYKATMEPADSPAVEPDRPLGPLPVDADPEEFVRIPGYVRFDVTPKDAAVYVDGYYAGLADDFSGSGQHLVLAPGAHHVELRATGYEPLDIDVDAQPGQTLDYRASLTRSK